MHLPEDGRPNEWSKHVAGIKVWITYFQTLMCNFDLDIIRDCSIRGHGQFHTHTQFIWNRNLGNSHVFEKNTINLFVTTGLKVV